MLDLAAAFITLTTLLTYVNYRFVRLPPTIGVMATALVFSLLAQGLSMTGYPVLEVEMQQIIRRIDFSEVLMTWFLPALLFAGALHVNLGDLRNYKWPIGLLATFGIPPGDVFTCTTVPVVQEPAAFKRSPPRAPTGSGRTAAPRRGASPSRGVAAGCRVPRRRSPRRP